METSSEYIPIIKKKGFLPNPIARFGVPKEFDGRIDSNVMKSEAHRMYWDEQFNYCINGYETGGLRIPGMYYYYLNFCYISTILRGNHHPEFVDIDYEFFCLVEEALKEKHGIILLKKRRAGVSEKLKGIIGHGLRFSRYGYKAGIVSGRDTYSELLFSKVKQHNSDVRPELYLHTSSNSSELYEMGYDERTDAGFIRSGSGNTVISKTMNTNPRVLVGNLFNLVAFEESGENDVLEKGYNATKPCFMVGNEMVGLPLVFGTGGDVSASAKDFQAMWAEADKYKLVRFRMHADRMVIGMFVGSRNTKGIIEENIPNIINDERYKGLSREQLLGVEDVKCAIDTRLQVREDLRKSNDPQKLFDELRDNPLNDNEAFLKFSGNPFNPEKLSVQHNVNIINKSDFYKPYILDWKRKDSGDPLIPLEIDMSKVRVAETEAEIRESIYISVFPKRGVRDLYVAGGDSYDIDKSVTSKSLGGMVVLARDSFALPAEHRMSPHAAIRQRPSRKEIFWENCLKLCVLYDLKSDGRSGNFMVDVAKPGIIDYFKRMGGRQYLAIRPQSLETEHSEQVHEFGCNLVPRARNTMISYMQSYVEDYHMNIKFDFLTRELMDFDVKARDSDNDCADALGLALIRHYDMAKLPQSEEDLSAYDPYPVEVFATTPDGDGSNRLIIANKVVNNKSVITKNGIVITDPLTLYLQ